MTSPARDERRASLAWVIALAVVLVALVGGVLVVQARRNAEAEDAARQAAVEQRGAHVMPFDQDRTTHRFEATAGGGTETVTALDATATDQVTLVEEHLRHEQALFAAGDFSDPVAIHGADMPGVDELATAARDGSLTVTYEPVPGGARLVYTATSPAVVDAVHRWFDAQVADHGEHATG